MTAGRTTRTWVVILTLAALAALAAPLTAGAGTPAGADTRNGSALWSVNWEVGDCYEQADVDADLVDFTTQVPCDQPHVVQSVAGAKLPKSLAAWTRSELLTTNRRALEQFAAKTCAPARALQTLYPDQAKTLTKLLAKHDVDEFLPPAFGRAGWALSDQESWDVGTKVLVCVFDFNPLPWSPPVGDLRAVATTDPLPNLRICQDITEVSTDFARCDGAHDAESLIWVGLPLKGQPADVMTWDDSDWAPFDKVCADFGKAIVGGSPAGIVFRADTDPSLQPDQGRRFFNCRTYPEDETKAFAAGQIMAGAGNVTVEFTDT